MACFLLPQSFPSYSAPFYHHKCFAKCSASRPRKCRDVQFSVSASLSSDEHNERKTSHESRRMFLLSTAVSAAGFVAFESSAFAARRKRVAQEPKEPQPVQRAGLPTTTGDDSSSSEVSEVEREKSLQSELANLIKADGTAPGVLRLAFHDAGCGGADGSIRLEKELSAPQNGGLRPAVDTISKAKDLNNDVSWADLIAIGGAAAVKLCGGPEILVGFGRKDSDKPGSPADELPSPVMKFSQLKSVFEIDGLTTQDLVSLSGAHTLGRFTEARNKKRAWDSDPSVFDNGYFKVLCEVKAKKTLPSAVMPSDAALLEDPESLALVEKYAADQNAFFTDFSESYKKMTLLQRPLLG